MASDTAQLAARNACAQCCAQPWGRGGRMRGRGGDGGTSSLQKDD
jgi:hypothetical protein